MSEIEGNRGGEAQARNILPFYHYILYQDWRRPIQDRTKSQQPFQKSILQGTFRTIPAELRKNTDQHRRRPL